MKLYEHVAALRESLDDTGLMLTTIGVGGALAGASALPVSSLAVLAVGQYVVVGTGSTLEGHLITGKSADTGAGTITLVPPLVNAQAAGLPVGGAMAKDDTYAGDIRRGVLEYSRYRPLVKRYDTLDLVADTDTYELPADFVEPVQTSFDAAIGLTSSLSVYGSYHTLVYRLSDQFSANGIATQLTMPPFGASGYSPIFGNPLDNPNSGFAPTDAREFTFIRANPPQLIVRPAPSLAQSLDFFYHATHVQPTNADDGTVPEEDVYLPLLYAKYLRCTALAAGFAPIMKHKVDGEEIDKSRAPAEYRAIAKEALAEFQRVLITPQGERG